MHNKFEKNRRKIKGSCQSGRKVVIHNSKSDLPLFRKLNYMLLTPLLKSFEIEAFVRTLYSFFNKRENINMKALPSFIYSTH